MTKSFCRNPNRIGAEFPILGDLCLLQSFDIRGDIRELARAQLVRLFNWNRAITIHDATINYAK